MKKKFTKGLSLKLDTLFLRNLTILLAGVFLWRGLWNIVDRFLFPDNFMASNLISMCIGIILLFVFDSEVENE